MITSTVPRSERVSFAAHSSPRDRQECIRKSWTVREQNRRRDLAAAEQTRLIRLLQGQFHRTAC